MVKGTSQIKVEITMLAFKNDVGKVRWKDESL